MARARIVYLTDHRAPAYWTARGVWWPESAMLCSPRSIGSAARLRATIFWPVYSHRSAPEKRGRNISHTEPDRRGTVRLQQEVRQHGKRRPKDRPRFSRRYRLQSVISIPMRLEDLFPQDWERDVKPACRSCRNAGAVKRKVRDMRSYVRNMRSAGCDGASIPAAHGASRRVPEESAFRDVRGGETSLARRRRSGRYHPGDSRSLEHSPQGMPRPRRGGRAGKSRKNPGGSIDDKWRRVSLQRSLLPRRDYWRHGPGQCERRARSLGAICCWNRDPDRAGSRSRFRSDVGKGEGKAKRQNGKGIKAQVLRSKIVRLLDREASQDFCGAARVLRRCHFLPLPFAFAFAFDLISPSHPPSGTDATLRGLHLTPRSNQTTPDRRMEARPSGGALPRRLGLVDVIKPR